MHIPKGYIYFAMAFSLGVEMLNIRLRKRREARTQVYARAPLKLRKKGPRPLGPGEEHTDVAPELRERLQVVVAGARERDPALGPAQASKRLCERTCGMMSSRPATIAMSGIRRVGADDFAS